MAVDGSNNTVETDEKNVTEYCQLILPSVLMNSENILTLQLSSCSVHLQVRTGYDSDKDRRKQHTSVLAALVSFTTKEK